MVIDALHVRRALGGAVALSAALIAAMATAEGAQAQQASTGPGSSERPETEPRASGDDSRRRVRIELRSPQYLTFYRVTPWAIPDSPSLSDPRLYERLCTAPCEVDLAPGEHRFAVPSIHGGVFIRAIDIARPGRLVADYADSAMTLEVGWTLMAFAFALVTLPATVLAYALDGPNGVDDAFAAVGIGGAVGTIALAVSGGTLLALDPGMTLRFE